LKCSQIYYFAVPIKFSFPASGQIAARIGKHVEHGDQITVVLVPLKSMAISPDFRHHVLQSTASIVQTEGLLRSNATFRISKLTIDPKFLTSFMCRIEKKSGRAMNLTAGTCRMLSCLSGKGGVVLGPSADPTPNSSTSNRREVIVRRMLWYLLSSCCRWSSLLDGRGLLAVVAVGRCHVVVLFT